MTTTAGSATASGVAAAGAGVAGSGVAAGTVLTTTGAVVAGASGAVVSSLASKAAISFINNGGDIGKTLNELGSSDSVKQLATAAITGGALAGLNASMGWDKATASNWSDKLGRNLSTNVADASIKTALGQGELEDNLKGAVVAAVGAGLAEKVGDLSTGEQAALDSFGNKVAHAIVGCGLGAAQKGQSGCTAGALGAVVAEATAELYNSGGAAKTFTSEIGQITAIVAAAATGQDIGIAQTAGANAVNNNFLGHQQTKLMEDALRKCQDTQCKNDVLAMYRAISEKQSGLSRDEINLQYAQIDAWKNQAYADCQSDACRIRVEQWAVYTKIVALGSSDNLEISLKGLKVLVNNSTWGDAKEIALPAALAVLSAIPIVKTGWTLANNTYKSVDTLLRPNGQFIGIVEKGATPNIRTITSQEFSQLQTELLRGAKDAGKYAGGKGAWYELPSGGRVGVRQSDASGLTLDINIPGFPRNLKIHQK